MATEHDIDRVWDAQYWDSAGTVVSYVKMLAAVVSDARPDMGSNAKIDL